MNHMMLIARFAGLVCERFTAQFQRISKALAFIVRILNNKHAALTSTYTNGLGGYGTLRARAHQGLRASRLRLTRSVALAIGIALSMQTTAVGIG